MYLCNYNLSLNDSNQINNFYNINPSFKEWLNKSNDITKQQIESAYNSAKDKLKAQLKVLKDKKEKEKINKLISNLSSMKKNKIKELKQSNKQIKAFKHFRKTYKVCNEAIDLANTESNGKNILDIDKNFLSEYRRILEYRHLDNDKLSKYSASDFQKKSQEILSKTKKAITDKRKDKKIENYIKSDEIWYRKALSYMGTKSKEKPRDSHSAKFDLTGENDLSNWMSNMSDNAKLSEIIIPASHDSGAYSTIPTSNIDVFGKAAQTHTVNFRGQLRSGIRYFDLRMNLENGIPVMAHDIINGAPVSEAIRQIVKFAVDHPKEIVLVEISHTSKECLEKFYKLPIVKELKNHAYSSNSKKLGNVTLGEVRNSNKNIIMFEEREHEIVDRYSEKERQSSDDVMLEKEIKNLIRNWTNNKTYCRLHKITPTHCATIKDFFSKGKRWKPLWNAVEKSNGNFKFLLNTPEFKEYANVVSYDDALGSVWFAKELIKINEERMKNF